ncbi:hypothetical protein BLNAU_3383 [Blattamonas nauphoetae]|uniref:Uncharacterized protein n=1 Tax=Blattamonas nauphoetae TaxID=2049346 RepID=A0ABQ9YCU6_9EUKA|nr:hypothetical protein BLNAU_3383 [Blattamonas nauphoetae]
MSHLEYLDELPTRCAIAESCGLVSILSDLVSSHSSIGLKSIASSLLALIQNALGTCENQITEHHPLNSQDTTSTTHSGNDLSKELLKLRTSMFNLTTQMAEQHEMVSSWMMKHDSILSRLDLTMRSDFLRESRFQRWSKQGADAIEIFDEDFIIKTGNTFRLRQRPRNEKTNFIPKTLFSPLISSDVAQLSFTMTYSQYGYVCGAVPARFIDTRTVNEISLDEHGVTIWGFQHRVQIYGSMYFLYPKPIEFVLDADCRVGRRTLTILKDGEKPTFHFYENISLPFRFMITPLHPSVSVTIKSLTFTTQPTLKDGKNEHKSRN